MRRLIVVTALLLSIGGCSGKPDPVQHVVRYELNMVGERAFADITARYTEEDRGFSIETNATVFAASWSREVTVHYPDVKGVNLYGSFTFDTSVPGEPTDPSLSKLRCRITVDGVLVADRLASSPTCTFTLSDTTPTPRP